MSVEANLIVELQEKYIEFVKSSLGPEAQPYELVAAEIEIRRRIAESLEAGAELGLSQEEAVLQCLERHRSSLQAPRNEPLVLRTTSASNQKGPSKDIYIEAHTAFFSLWIFGLLATYIFDAWTKSVGFVSTASSVGLPLFVTSIFHFVVFGAAYLFKQNRNLGILISVTAFTCLLSDPLMRVFSKREILYGFVELYCLGVGFILTSHLVVSKTKPWLMLETNNQDEPKVDPETLKITKQDRLNALFDRRY